MSGNFVPPFLPRYLTLDSVPIERFCRTFSVPNDPAWIGLLDGIVSALTDPRLWRQFGTLTPEEMADAWQVMLDDSWQIEGDCVDCCPLFRTDPATGLPEVSYDDGLTYFKFPEGEYNPDETGPYATPPPALGKGSDSQDKCYAAANATAVIAQFYQETAGQAAADLFNTVLNVNKFLFNVNQTLLRLIYPDAVQLGIALDWNTFDFDTYATAPTLSDDVQAQLLCILYDNATVTDGVVSFDFAAVLAATPSIGDGLNPAATIALLLQYMAEPGLNSAGGVQVSVDPDCDECGTWCFKWDFLLSEGSWIPANTDWHFGQGFVGQYLSHSPDRQSDATIRLTLGAPILIGSITANYDKPVSGGVNDETRMFLKNGGTTTYINTALNPTGTDLNTSWPTNALADWIEFDVNLGDDALAPNQAIIKSIVFTGDGANPFGADNC